MMSKREAIEILKSHRRWLALSGIIKHSKILEALEMAIRALTAE
jgi:hypothetical protein